MRFGKSILKAPLMLAVVFAAIIFLVSVSPIPSASASFPGANGKIAFTSDSDGPTYDIWVMNADGSGAVNITNTPNTFFDQSPDWSADGTEITFTTNRDGNFEIYKMDADGSNPMRVTNNAAFDGNPRFSPDGTQIAFERDLSGNSEIFVINVDGTGETNLTNHSATDTIPSWSPDGTQIAFTTTRDGNQQIYLMDADGSNPLNISNNAFNDTHPSWSPDGTQIAFTSTRLNANGDVFVMDANGSNQTPLTNLSSLDGRPDWSPDGSKITFDSNRDDGNGDNFVMNADGSGQTNLTNSASLEFTPDWQPASLIVFQTNRDGNDEIYVIGSDGSNPTNLTNDVGPTASDLQPSWSRDGSQIAFSANRSAGVGLGPHDVWVMDADGSNLHQLTTGGQFGVGSAWSADGTKIAYIVTTTPNQIRVINTDGTGQTQLTFTGGNFNPSWSSDGSQIAFSSDRDGNSEIYTMDSNGANQTRITNNSDTDVHPYWCPVSDQIAFASDRNGDLEIYVMNSDGSGQTRLTTSAGTDYQPAWSDDCSKIAFASNRDGNFEIYVMDADGSNQVNITNNSANDSAPDWAGPTLPTEITPPTDVTLNVDKDSFLRSGNPNRNEGINPRLRIQASGNNRALAAFDLTGIDTGSVTSATLVLTIAENANNWGPNDDRTVDAHPLNVDFAEGNGKQAEVTPQSERTRGTGEGVTWNCATDDDISDQNPDCVSQWSGGDFGSATASPVIHLNGLTGEVSWDVTADVSTGATAWMVKKTNEAASGKVKYYSKEGAIDAGDIDLAPRLILEITP